MARPAQRPPIHKHQTPAGWIYGLNPVREALRAGCGLRAVYVYSGRGDMGDIRREAEAGGVPFKVMHDHSFFESRFPKGHQGVAAETGGESSLGLEDLLSMSEEGGDPPFFIILDQIEDPGNLGAILRSAEAAGVHGVVIEKRRTAPLGPAAWKASAGALGYVRVAVVSNIKHAIGRLKEMGVTVVGAEAGTHPPPWEVDLRAGAALVIGSEGRGLRRTVREACDLLVGLPMRGRVGSLNASVAAGVLIYEVLRQRC